MAQVNVALWKLLDAALSGAIAEPSLFAWSTTFIRRAAQVVGVLVRNP